MFSFFNTVLLMCMWTGYKVDDANSVKKGIEALIFTTPVRLHGYDFTIKHSFNKALKFFEEFEDFGFVTNQVNPNEFTIIINKANIVFLIAKGIDRRTSDIQKN
jgi:hypothetical protein